MQTIDHLYDDMISESPVDLWANSREHLHKICVIGDIGTGKTAFIRRLIHHEFIAEYKSTVDVEVSFKQKEVNGDLFKMEFNDIGGHEFYGNSLEKYFRGTTGIFIMVDCTRPTTVDSAIEWKHEFDTKYNKTGWADPMINPIILLVSKIDLVPDEILSKVNFDTFCHKYGFHSWLKISAKTGTGIEKAFNTMIAICKNICVKSIKPIKSEFRIPIEISTLVTHSVPVSNSIAVAVTSTVPEPDIWNFIMKILDVLDEPDAFRSVIAMKKLFVALYYDPEMNFTRNIIKSHQNLHTDIDMIHDMLVNESVSDSDKINNVLNFIMERGKSHNI